MDPIPQFTELELIFNKFENVDFKYDNRFFNFQSKNAKKRHFDTFILARNLAVGQIRGL